MEDDPFVRAPEAFSLFGEPLYRSPIRLWLPSDEEGYQRKMRELEENLKAARKEYAENPEDPERLLWLGRRTGILGDFRKAAAIYSFGVEKWPNDPRFYRFRGHRFVILRLVDLAITDFERAAELIKGKPDEPELYASGGPNRDKMGVSSFHWNVWYHLGFTYLVAGRFEEAAEAYRRCMEVSDNPESVIATSHWLHMTLIRLGRWDEAEELLQKVKPNMELVEVGDYYETLLMQKGFLTPEELLEKARSEGPVRFMTRAQAVGNLYLAKGETEKVVEVFSEILSTGEWTGGVFLLAEAELRRQGRSS
ncbi:MAG TPA: tetratricopeptide repeat protein [Patescibacteria group bacterium]|nr:tetratricopeptide repeat protein [Patescibacteria group bacterium]